MLNYSIDNLAQRLAEVRMWCFGRVTDECHTSGVHTSLLRPMNLIWNPLMSDVPYWLGEKSNTDLQSITRVRREMVDTVAKGRASLLYRHKDCENHPRGSLNGGRLLLFNPDQSLSDGAASIESHRFFDQDNIPAWDVWICYLNDETSSTWQSYLICWVPPVLLECVDNGIAVNPEGCICWVDNLDTPFMRELNSNLLEK